MRKLCFLVAEPVTEMCFTFPMEMGIQETNKQSLCLHYEYISHLKDFISTSVSRYATYLQLCEPY